MNTFLAILLTVSITISILALVADGLDARKYRKSLSKAEVKHCSRCEAYGRVTEETLRSAIAAALLPDADLAESGVPRRAARAAMAELRATR